MTKEIREIQNWLEEHPAHFKEQIRLVQLIKKYAEDLNKEQEAGFREIGF